MKKKNSLDAQLQATAKSAKDYVAGKTKWRTWIVGKDGTRTMLMESGPEAKARHHRIDEFKSMRTDLGLSQSGMAAALRVSTKTVQGWEIGNPIPDPLFILAQLLHDLPAVRKRLLAA